MSAKVKSVQLQAIAVVLLAIIVTSSLQLPVFAAENKNVTRAGKGVVQVCVIYRDDYNRDQIISIGSGFFIDSNTVLTCDHVANLDQYTMKSLAESFNKSEKEILKRIRRTVIAADGMSVKVKQVIFRNEELDLAAIRLETSVNGKEILPFRPDIGKKQTETVYAIGVSMNNFGFRNVLTIANGTATYYSGNEKRFAVDSNGPFGAFGGPLVDEKGYVVGICQSLIKSGTKDFLYVISIKNVMESLKKQGIHYSTKYAKKNNTLRIKTKSKTLKRAKLKKAVKFSIGATKAKGKVTYILDKKAEKAKIKVTSKGKVTIPKKCKKGTYKITVKASGNNNYKPGKKVVTIKVK